VADVLRAGRTVRIWWVVLRAGRRSKTVVHTCVYFRCTGGSDGVKLLTNSTVHYHKVYFESPGVLAGAFRVLIASKENEMRVLLL